MYLCTEQYWSRGFYFQVDIVVVVVVVVVVVLLLLLLLLLLPVRMQFLDLYRLFSIYLCLYVG